MQPRSECSSELLVLQSSSIGHPGNPGISETGSVAEAHLLHYHLELPGALQYESAATLRTLWLQQLHVRDERVKPKGERERSPQSVHAARDGALLLLPACRPRA